MLMQPNVAGGLRARQRRPGVLVWLRVWGAFMDLKTTTRPNRNKDRFLLLQSVLRPPPNGRPLEVLNVGPGLAVKYFGRLSEESVPGWDLFRRIESGIRRVPMPDVCFESYETRELLEALDRLPINLTILDVNSKVLRVVKRSTAKVAVATVNADLGIANSPSLAPYAEHFDVVVAQAVLGRIKSSRREIATENLRRMLRPGGVLLSAGVAPTADCVPIGDHAGLFRKIVALRGRSEPLQVADQ